MARALKIHPRDNVAVLLGAIEPGETAEVAAGDGTLCVRARQPVAFGHKIALADLGAGSPIVKYGEEIGRAKTAIAAGDWIHLHNLHCGRGHEEANTEETA